MTDLHEKPDLLRYWVWLSLVFGAGSMKLLSYLQKLGSPASVYDAVQAGMLRDLPHSAQKAMTVHSLNEADNIVYYCRTHDIALLPLDSEDYPPMLREIGTPPVLLTAMGNTDLLKNPLSFSVVGTRHPSEYTERVTTSIVSALAKTGFTIVSGFAKGVDAIAHAAALHSGGSTIGVLGCGVNVNYPRENQHLRELLLSGGNGLLLSEYLPGSQPTPANFPKRNRILSGLGYASAVMEAALRSGSLITAQCAAEQGRYLFCVPPADVFDPRYAGLIPLMRDGAIPLMSHEDVLMVYYSRYPQYYPASENGIRPSERLVFGSAEQSSADTPPVQQELHRRLPKESLPTLESAVSPAPLTAVPGASGAADAGRNAFAQDAPLPDDEDGKRIVLFLREHGDTYADDIADALDMDLSVLLSALTMLELEGFVDSLFGKQFRAV